MGVAFCVIFEKDVPPHGTLGADKMTLAKGYEELDAVAEANGLPMLGNFLCQDPDEVAELMEMGVEEIGAPPEEWFAAAEGLKAVQALIAHLRDHPKAVARANQMLAELEQIETELTAAARAEVKFHFALVF